MIQCGQENPKIPKVKRARKMVKQSKSRVRMILGKT
jgi:hypothetical protein